MNTEQFVNGVVRHMRARSQGDIEFIQAPPPGRKPNQVDALLHNWYVGLANRDKEMIRQLIHRTVEGAVYGFLMILDHKMFIEGAGEKGELELYYLDTFGRRTRLNALSGIDGKDLEYYFKTLRDSEPDIA